MYPHTSARGCDNTNTSGEGLRPPRLLMTFAQQKRVKRKTSDKTRFFGWHYLGLYPIVGEVTFSKPYTTPNTACTYALVTPPRRRSLHHRLLHPPRPRSVGRAPPG